MSKINDLIKELCPNGVEYKLIKEVFELFSGMTGVSNKWAEEGNCRFIDYMNAYKNNKIDVSKLPYATVKNLKQNELRKGDLLLTSASEVPDECAVSSVIEDDIKKGVFMDDHLFGLRLKEEYSSRINTTFINYYLNSKSFRNNLFKAVRGVTRFYVLNDNYVKLSVPIPPLEIQKEIVKILDKFGELETELEAELEIRKSQYDFWREKLLDGRKKIYVKLGSLCKIITKGTTPKKYADTGINFIKTEAFVGDYVDKAKLSFVDEETHNGFLKRSILEENDILFTIAGATIGKMTVVTNDLLPANTNQALAIIRLNDDVNLNYIKHILKSNYMKEYIKLCVKGSAQPNLNLQQLNNFEFPFPSAEEQERIVNILDKFDKLVNDISVGLPAEIELRRKQYEYYRNRLLSFEELTNE